MFDLCVLETLLFLSDAKNTGAALFSLCSIKQLIESGH